MPDSIVSQADAEQTQRLNLTKEQLDALYRGVYPGKVLIVQPNGADRPAFVVMHFHDYRQIVDGGVISELRERQAG